MISACVIGISGYSGSGKTTLIEQTLSELKKEGLTVGVLKHSHHTLSIGDDEKDTGRFYRAGADFVFAHDKRQGFARHRREKANLNDILEFFPCDLDLIIVEGHKNSTISTVWIETKKHYSRKKDKRDVVLYRDDQRSLEKMLGYIHGELKKCYSRRPINAGVLVGGKSTRMGKSKSMLKMGGITLVEKSFNTLSKASDVTVLLGKDKVPPSLKNVLSLPDVKGVQGPMAGMLSAFRWDPHSTWLIAAVDMPFMNVEAWDWLLRQRKPGAWAVIPRLKSIRGIETTGGCYEPMIFDYMELLSRRGVFKLQMIADHPKIIKPVIPESLAYAWKNVNTVNEWKSAFGSM
jgi:molybdopterin-guanine dinucleotide biosynthesis protein MobB